MSTSQANDNLSWLLEDAKLLYSQARKRSAILLLLCGIAAMSRQAFPKPKSSSPKKSPPRKPKTGNLVLTDGEAFEKFLASKMRRPGRAQIHNQFLPSENRCETFEYMIYKFLRCPLIHEGNMLEASDPEGCAVALDWDSIAPDVKTDVEKNQVVLGGGYVFDLLTDAMSHELDAR